MRLYATATLTAACLALLSACVSPPGEIDSELRTNTASDVSIRTTITKTGTSPASNVSATDTSATDTTTTSDTTTATSATTSTADSSTMNSSTSATSSIMVHTPKGIPGVIDCVGTPTKRPKSLSLSCATASDKLRDITWETWNETTAHGTATRETRVCGGTVCKGKDTSGQLTKTEVTVDLSAPTMTPQGPAFTVITVNGANIVL